MANAPGLRFTNGVTTVTISDGTDGYLLKYDPKNKASDELEVTEQATFLALGGLDAVNATIEKINLLFTQGREHQGNNTITTVYVERLTTPAGTWWRSELANGLQVPARDSLDSGTINGKYEIDITYTRKNWWEGTGVAVPLSNANGTNVTTGLTIYNHDDTDTGMDNWVEIAAGAILGDLPTPAYIQVQNTTASRTMDNVYIGLNATSPALFNPILEAEDATGGVKQPGTADTTNYSGGYYREFTAASSTEAVAFTWTITPTQMSAAGGQWYQPILRHVGGVGGKIRFRMEVDGYPVWQGTQIAVDDGTAGAKGLSLLRSLLLPPWNLFLTSSIAQVNLIMTYQAATGSTLKCDFIQLTPVEQWIFVKYLFSWISNTRLLVIDGITKQIFACYSNGTYQNTMFNSFGDFIHLEPAVKQRLYILRETNTVGNYTNVADTSKVTIYYRPRRLTLN